MSRPVALFLRLVVFVTCVMADEPVRAVRCPMRRKFIYVLSEDVSFFLYDGLILDFGLERPSWSHQRRPNRVESFI